MRYRDGAYGVESANRLSKLSVVESCGFVVSGDIIHIRVSHRLHILVS